jgi:hypothetical protein
MANARADAYCELALWGIGFSQSPSGLRRWWAEEAFRRELYGLSQEQIDTLIEACRKRIADLGEIEEDASEEPVKKPKSKTRRRAAI